MLSTRSFVLASVTIAALSLTSTYAAAAPSSGGGDKVTKESITSGGQARTYYLYVPESAAGKPSPLIVLLHGSGRTGDVLIDEWKGLAKKQGIVLAGPEAVKSAQWQVPVDGPEFLYDVVETIKKNQRIDDRRVYLFGHSAGAVFSLYMGLLESRYFAGVALSAGAFRDPSEFSSIDVATRKIPFAVFLGTNDRFFSVKAARQTRDAFVKAGLPFELTEIQGHDHNYYARSGEINKKAWQFLSGIALDSEPEYETHNFK